MPRSARTHHTRIAHPRSSVIPEGDGVPSTHTHLGAVPDRTVTTGPHRAAPLPLDAPSPIGAIPAVIAMGAIVLTVAVISILVVLDGHPDRVRIAAGFVGLIAAWCALLASPVVMARLYRQLSDSGRPAQSHRMAHPIGRQGPPTPRQALAREDVR